MYPENSFPLKRPIHRLDSSSRVIFLDRDGVINQERAGAYIRTPEEWVPIPGSLEAIARLCAAGHEIIILTNQSGLGRGLLTLDDLEAIHTKLVQTVEDHGGHIAGIYFCPHTPTEDCSCRKPKDGLIRLAESELGCRAKNAPFIGDQLTDVKAARSAECRPFLVRTGRGKDIFDEELSDVEIHSDLSSAADAILGETQ